MNLSEFFGKDCLFVVDRALLNMYGVCLKYYEERTLPDVYYIHNDEAFDREGRKMLIKCQTSIAEGKGPYYELDLSKLNATKVTVDFEAKDLAFFIDNTVTLMKYVCDPDDTHISCARKPYYEVDFPK